MAELASTNIYGHLTVSGDVRVSSIIGKADVISIPTTVLMEHADFGQQLIVKRNGANLAAAITYENSSGILGRAGFAGTGTYAIYYGTSTTAAWEIDASGVLQKGTIPWSRLSNVPSYASRWPSLSEIGAAPASHTHDYLPLSGGVLTGTLTVPERLYIRKPETTGGWARNIAYQTPDGSSTLAQIYFYGSGASISRIGINYGGYSSSDGIHIVKSSGNVGIGTSSPAYKLDVSGDVRATGTFRGSLTGNASTATKLATARTIKIGNTGKSFDGSANVTWTLSEIGAEPALAANRKRQIFVQSSTPSGAQTGDIWIVT